MQQSGRDSLLSNASVSARSRLTKLQLPMHGFRKAGCDVSWGLRPKHRVQHRFNRWLERREHVVNLALEDYSAAVEDDPHKGLPISEPPPSPPPAEFDVSLLPPCTAADHAAAADADEASKQEVAPRSAVEPAGLMQSAVPMISLEGDVVHKDAMESDDKQRDFALQGVNIEMYVAEVDGKQSEGLSDFVTQGGDVEKHTAEDGGKQNKDLSLSNYVIRLQARMSYMTGRYAKHAPRWQFVVWCVIPL